jgi:hypothetical protein
MEEELPLLPIHCCDRHGVTFLEMKKTGKTNKMRKREREREREREKERERGGGRKLEYLQQMRAMMEESTLSSAITSCIAIEYYLLLLCHCFLLIRFIPIYICDGVRIGEGGITCVISLKRQ